MPDSQRDPADPITPAVGADRDHPPPRPRWVKVVAVVALVVAVLVLVMLVVGGEHGPGRHLPGGDSGGETAPEGHSPPFGGH